MFKRGYKLKIFRSGTKSSRKKLQSIRRRHGKKFKAACLSLGLATAWGGEVQADLTLQVSVTPTRTLSNAFIYYGNNLSTGRFLPLGTLSENETSVFTHLFSEQDSRHEFMDDIEKILPKNDKVPGYFIAGLYDEDGTPGMTLSFPNTSVIDSGLSWNDVFPSFTEQGIVDNVLAGAGSFSTLSGFVSEYGDNSYLEDDGPLPTPYGQQSYLASFSAASPSGTAIVTVVPEPSGMALIATGAGALLFSIRCFKKQ